jgi:hypothetical protein
MPHRLLVDTRGMDAQAYDRIRRLRQEMHDAYWQLEGELEQARGRLQTSALHTEDSVGFLTELEAMKRRSEERRAREAKAREKLASMPLRIAANEAEPRQS